ncbi:holo-ACP synthase [Candidatus Deianiraea vastatrix]|uniref:Holo-[acyl-carrier-protein] synthase n=1 Tax=Candidatus Deianiraea vastatrix TaxID=2163644 RepID=A0A5B8XJJ4_9RICK|nr:holo-ACP synthase [Candidatus Deianiraea vastatrix]QED23727.1 Holo-[acyl-carrier-protein] synthase [Candidatus Deianiraea vastatrix]
MIIGTGIDICEKNRIAKILSENPRFIQRILTKNEQEIAAKKSDLASFVAKRWAAKEAVSKAFGCGIGAALSFLDIEISNDEHGRPLAKILKSTIETPLFTGTIDEIKIHLSISDTHNITSASVVVEGI